MNAKPSDFFLNIIDFFGIVIPGLILYFLYGDLLFKGLNLSINDDNAGKFITIFCFAYIFGHFLFGFSVWMNSLSIYLIDDITRKYYNSVCGFVTLPSEIPSKNREETKEQRRGIKAFVIGVLKGIKSLFKRDKNLKYYTDVYYSAFSYLRLNNSAAMEELERQAAEYKLFRSLTLLFLIDFILNTVDLFVNYLPTEASIFRSVFSLILAYLTFRRFDFLFDWTYRLTYDFYLQATKAKNDQSKNQG